jgi:hypothetical protein
MYLDSLPSLKQGLDGIMVKTAKRPKKKAAEAHEPGRPGRKPVDPKDLRSHRLAFRIHPDLTEELSRVARVNGEVRTAFVERMLIAVINNSYGYEVLDAIGRRIHYPTDHDHVQRGPAQPTPFRPGTFGSRVDALRQHPRTHLTVDDLPPAPKRR